MKNKTLFLTLLLVSLALGIVNTVRADYGDDACGACPHCPSWCYDRHHRECDDNDKNCAEHPLLYVPIGEIMGKVTCQDGQPLIGGIVTVEGVFTKLKVYTTVTNSNGFYFLFVTPGYYNVTVKDLSRNVVVIGDFIPRFRNFSVTCEEPVTTTTINPPPPSTTTTSMPQPPPPSTTTTVAPIVTTTTSSVHHGGGGGSQPSTTTTQPQATTTIIEVSTSSTIPTEPTTTTTIEEPVTTTIPVTTTTILACNPIIIPKFELIPEWRKILVYWNTATEPCVVGFRVLRKCCRQDEIKEENIYCDNNCYKEFTDISGLIIPQGSDTVGSSYCFDDDNVLRDIWYCYKIEIEYGDGSTSYSEILEARTKCSDERFHESIATSNICEYESGVLSFDTKSNPEPFHYKTTNIDKSCSEYFNK